MRVYRKRKGKQQRRGEIQAGRGLLGCYAPLTALSLPGSFIMLRGPVLLIGHLGLLTVLHEV